MSQNQDRNVHYNEGDINEGINRNNSDGSLRCPIFVQDTEELIDEDGTIYCSWIDEEAWEDEQRARQNAILTSPFASLTTATAKPSKNTPVVGNTSAAIPFAITTTNIPSVPSAATETFSDIGNEGENDSDDYNDDRHNDYGGEYDDDNIDDNLEDEIENNTENEDENDSGDEIDVSSNPENNEENINTDTVEATPSNPLNNTIIICYNRSKFSIQFEERGSFKAFTNTVWDSIMNMLFIIGVFMWLSFQRKSKDELKARYAIHLASGASIPGMTIEKETHSEESENEIHSENDVVDPNHGGDLDYKDYLDHMEISIRGKAEGYFSGPTHVMAYIQDARGLRYKILFEVADCWNYNLDFYEEAAMDLLKKIVVRDVRKRLNIFLQTPIILRRWTDEDDNEENAPVTRRIFYDTLPEHDDGEDHDREDRERENGGENAVVEDDNEEDDNEEDDNEEDDDEEEEEEEEDGEEEEEDGEDEEEDNEEQENEGFNIPRLLHTARHHLTQTRGIEWILQNWRACEQYLEQVLREWNAMIRALRQDIRWIDDLWRRRIQEPADAECVFCERRPLDLRVSEHSRKRYRRKYGLVRLLLYRG